MKLISKEQALNIQNELMNEHKFSIEQMAELIGLSIAQAICDAYPLHDQMKPCLIIIGSGVNGAKGLVCARHMKNFGYSPVIFLITELLRPFFLDLQKQCEMVDIPFLQDLPEPETIADEYEFIVDAIYGYTFEPPVRPATRAIIDKIINSKLPICSIDIPSGWNMDIGCVKSGPNPDVLISIILPKHCLCGIEPVQHYLVGRILPPEIKQKYELNLPEFPGHSLFLKLS